MSRLFVAIPVPEPVATRLAALRDDDLVGARWISADRLHLTIRFIGEVAKRRVEGLAEELAMRSFPRMDLRISGVGTFGALRDPRVMVAHVEDHPSLTEVRRFVDDAVGRFVSIDETLPFRPHITLARFRRPDPVQVREFCRKASLELEMPAEFVNLYESRLRRSGPSYRIVRSYPLEG